MQVCRSLCTLHLSVVYSTPERKQMCPNVQLLVTFKKGQYKHATYLPHFANSSSDEAGLEVMDIRTNILKFEFWSDTVTVPDTHESTKSSTRHHLLQR